MSDDLGYKSGDLVQFADLYEVEEWVKNEAYSTDFYAKSIKSLAGKQLVIRNIEPHGWCSFEGDDDNLFYHKASNTRFIFPMILLKEVNDNKVPSLFGV